jgi:hypothetical protein
MSLQLHRPDGRGGLEGRPPEQDWRTQLRSRRWGTGRGDGRLPDLRNPEKNPTSALISVLFWIALAILTFVILVAGYGSGFWS